MAGRTLRIPGTTGEGTGTRTTRRMEARTGLARLASLLPQPPYENFLQPINVSPLYTKKAWRSVLVTRSAS